MNLLSLGHEYSQRDILIFQASEPEFVLYIIATFQSHVSQNMFINLFQLSHFPTAMFINVLN